MPKTEKHSGQLSGKPLPGHKASDSHNHKHLFTTDYKPISPLDLDKMVHRLDGMGITVCIVEF